jgi:hypothetical protein
MAAVSEAPGLDVHYRTVLEVNHEPEDLALYGGLVGKWQAAWQTGEAQPNDQPRPNPPPSAPPMPWAYAGADYHLGAWGWQALIPCLAGIASEQLTHANWVYVEGSVTSEAILGGLRAGRTCATRGRTNDLQELIGISPVPGLPASVPVMATPHLELDLVFPKPTTRPMFVQVFRDGVEVSGMMETYRKRVRHLSLSWDDTTAASGPHAYAIVIAGKLVTSPILIRKV